MRWRFEGDLVLSNGYSVSEYPKGITEKDLRAVEQTWPGDKHKFIHRIGPLREKLGKSKKRSLGMVETTVLPEGVRQTYVERGEDINEGYDRVVELLWLFN